MPRQQAVVAQEIDWNVDGIAVHATLTLPHADERRPALCFVAGSGPTDRDWLSPLLPGDNGSGKLLADALTQAGYVTLRYDKRASGPNAAENVQAMLGKVSMQSHSEELEGAIATLVQRPEVDADRLFALTNSEGGIHALHVQLHASHHRFAGLILTGLPGRPMVDVMRSQLVPQLEPLPDGEELVRRYDAAMSDIMAGGSAAHDDSLPGWLQQVLSSLTIPVNNPFARELLGVDPAQLLREVSEPALVVIGKKDIQVDWQADGRALEAAVAGHRNVTFAYPDDANHVLKYEPEDRDRLQAAEAAAAYNAPDRHLDADALDEIRTWLAAQTAVS